MPRSNWKGFISFGLVNIPIMLFTAENTSQKVAFHQLDSRNNARIKYKRVNAETGKEVPWDKIIKGYEYSKDTIFVVGEGELEKIAGDNARTIAIESFISEEDIGLIDVQKAYYIVPDKNGDKGYVILREALKSLNKIGIAKVIISTKEYLAAVAVFKDALILYLLHYHAELLDLSELKLPSADLKKYKISKKEIDISKQLIQSMSKKWKPQSYKDEYKQAVSKWAEQKAKKMPPKVMKPRAHIPAGKAVDFVDLLKKSLQGSKSSKVSKSQVKSRSRQVHAKPRSSVGKHATRH